MKKHTAYFVIIISVLSCGEESSKKTSDQNNSTSSSIVAVPEYRDSVSKKPVAQYQERTENPLNDWYFSVKLYETPKTFQYLIKLNYEEIRGEDTLKLPNFGIPPTPVIQKGKEKYSCIIGFLDKDNKFREYKKVYVKNNSLKITAIKHYAVSSYSKEEEK